MAYLHCLLVILVVMVTTFGAEAKMVDMTHFLNKDSRHFQSFRDFELTVAVNTSFGENLWLLAKDFVMSEHTGTHIDAPIHTYPETKWLHEIPLERLMGPAVVFDITEKAKTDPDYALSMEDIKEHEEKYGELEEGSIIFIYTKGAEVYGNVNKYYGTETPDDLTTLHFPGFGSESTGWLIKERKIRGIGTDRMSFDVGKSLTYPVHYQTSTKNVWGLENVNRIGDIPARGATVFIMPIPIEYGTGGPVRIVAFTGYKDLPFTFPIPSSAGIASNSFFFTAMSLVWLLAAVFM